MDYIEHFACVTDLFMADADMDGIMLSVVCRRLCGYL